MERLSIENSPHGALFSVIVLAVCEHFRVTVDQISSKVRTEALCVPRHVIFYLCREMTDATVQSIGALFARDHGTVIHAFKSVCDRLETDKSFQKAVISIKDRIAEKMKMQ